AAGAIATARDVDGIASSALERPLVLATLVVAIAVFLWGIHHGAWRLVTLSACDLVASVGGAVILGTRAVAERAEARPSVVALIASTASLSLLLGAFLHLRAWTVLTESWR